MSRRLAAGIRTTSCPSCSRTSLPARAFTTSARSRAADPQDQASTVPPESPRYVPSLVSFQPTVPDRPRIRGFLPPPRDILARVDEARNKRYSDENVWRNLKRSIARPQGGADGEAAAAAADASGRTAWRQRQALQRRRNLVEGVRDLKVRESKTRHYQRKRSAARWEERRALQAERDARADEALTRPSTTAAMQWQKGRVPDPNREARLAEMRARVEAAASRKAADRQDALHTLYVHAKDFIVNEEQLDAAIEQCFGSAAMPRTFGDNGVSVWDHRQPENIAARLARANRTRRTPEDAQGFAATAKKRIQKIAEELTGGKM